MGIFRCLAVATLWIAVQGVAWAGEGQWLRAEGSRFIVFGRQRESTLIKTVQDLETFDYTLRFLTGLRPEGARKLEVYLLSGPSDLDLVYPDRAASLRGFYRAGPESVSAFVLFGPTSSMLGGTETLFHEYAHHFMAQQGANVYPSWYKEGFAEYFSATVIKTKVVEYGRVAEGRNYELVFKTWLPIETILFAPLDSVKEHDQSQFYGQSWLLTHYLFSTQERLDKLLRYLDGLSRGVEPKDAFRQGFGMEVEALDKELRDYAKKGEIAYFKLSRPPQTAGVSITVTRLSEAHDDLLLLELRLKDGVRSELRDKTLAMVKESAARHPDDPYAEQVLTRAEIVAGALDAAEQRVDAALAMTPDDPNWLYLKAMGLFARARQAPAARATFARQARIALVRANKVRPDDVPTLYRYGRSLFGEPGEPSENTTNVLYRALKLAPQVDEVVFATAYALMARGEYTSAAQLLTGVAYKPHGGPMAQSAQELLQYAARGVLPRLKDEEQ